MMLGRNQWQRCLRRSDGWRREVSRPCARDPVRGPCVDRLVHRSNETTAAVDHQRTTAPRAGRKAEAATRRHKKHKENFLSILCLFVIYRTSNLASRT